MSADAVLVRALEECRTAGGGDPELVRIEPELAPRSGPVPLLMSANSLKEEIACALLYAREADASDIRRMCLAFAGFTLREVQAFGRRIGLPVLDGTLGLGEGSVFLSDLEQTKGYEFDTMCVLNCAAGVIPDPHSPDEEQFRLASRLYVAMTRAKRELVLSHSGAISPWLADLSQPLLATDRWEEHVNMAAVALVGESCRMAPRKSALSRARNSSTRHML
jgi:hypothetical protein